MISAKMVKDLREATGAGMMDCKKALVEVSGDMEKAMDFLREKGLSAAAKKAGRIAAEGVVGSFVSEDLSNGSLVEVNCETDFVAKTEGFTSFVANIAKDVASGNPADIDALLAQSSVVDGTKSVKDLVTEQVATIGENVSPRRFANYTIENGAVESYIHMGGKIGVLVEFTCDEAKKSEADFKVFMHDIAMHIAAAAPTYVRNDEVPAGEIEKEREFLKTQALNEGKPEKIVDKMVEGRINKYFSKVCLLSQDFVKDTDKKIAQVVSSQGQDVSVTRFTRFVMGEGLQKKEDDFVAEVMSQTSK